MRAKTHKLKGLKIQKDGEDYKLFKVWPGGKMSGAILITSDKDEFVREYTLLCKHNGIKPDEKKIYRLVNDQL